MAVGKRKMMRTFGSYQIAECWRMSWKVTFALKRMVVLCQTFSFHLHVSSNDYQHIEPDRQGLQSQRADQFLPRGP